MKSLILVASAAIGLAAATTNPAAATIVLISYQGVVLSGFSAGDFGDGDLSGSTYKAVFTFDITPGGAGDYSLTKNSRHGIGSLSPSLGVELTIKGSTRFIDGSKVAQILSESTPTFSEQLDEAYSSNGDYVYESATRNDNVLPATIDEPFSTNTVGDTVSGFFKIGASSGTLSPTSIVETITSPTPEPGAWMLMVVGTGMVGLAIRSRRRRVTLSLR